MALHTGTTGPVIRAVNMEPEVLRQISSILSGARDGILRSTDFAVTQNGGGAMSVIVSSGFALLSGTDNSPVQGQYHCYNDANVTVTVPTANGSNPRIDLICLTWEDAFYSGSLNSVILQDVAGTPAASPLVPATPADSLVLAHIYVGTGVLSILTANINGTTGTNNPDVYPFHPMRAEGILWNASPTATSITTTATPGTVIAGTPGVVNVPANRKIRLRYTNVASNSAAGSNVTQFTRDGAVIGTPIFGYMATTGQYLAITAEFIDTPAAGVHQYAVNGWVSAITRSEQAMGSFTVEDIGPV